MSTMPTDSLTNAPAGESATDPGAAPSETPETTPQGPETPPETPVKPPESDDRGEHDQDVALAEQLATVTAERDALAVQVARMETAAKHDVPADLLTATTADDLDAQAERLAAYVNQRRRTPDFGGGNRGEPITPPAYDPLRAALGR
jgi:hypothetical protein